MMTAVMGKNSGRYTPILNSFEKKDMVSIFFDDKIDSNSEFKFKALSRDCLNGVDLISSICEYIIVH